MSLADILDAMDHKPRLVELGKIKIGGLGEERTSKAGNVFRLPEKYDHFRITTMARDHGRLVYDEALEKALASDHADDDGKLRNIPIRVLSNDLDDVMQTRWVWYNGKRCAASSDGKLLTSWWDSERKAWREEPNIITWNQEWADRKDGKGNPLFKLHSTLNCVIFSDRSRLGGVYKFRTTSRITFDGLYSSLLHVSSLTGGVLVGMPLMLVVRPVQVSPDGKTTTVYTVHVELRGVDVRQLQQDAVNYMQFAVSNREQLQVLNRQYRALLVAPGEEAQRETDDIVAEFHPDEAADEEPEADDALDAILGAEGEQQELGDVAKPAASTEPKK